MTNSLPATPSLVSLKKQAKKLLRAFRNNETEALATVQQYFPQSQNFHALRDAQLTIARSYGFLGWDEPKLNQMLDEFDDLMDEPEALEDADVSCLKLLLIRGLDLDKQDQHGKTLLHIMARQGNIEAIKFLLDNDADPSIRDNLYGGAVVGWAHFNKQFHVRDYLLNRVADATEISCCGMVDRLDEVLKTKPELVHFTSNVGSGNTPLHLVCNWMGSDADRTLREKIIDLLLGYGADINAKNLEGQTPLQASEDWGEDHNWELLLARGAR